MVGSIERASTVMHRVKNEGGNSFGFYSAESSVAWTRDRLEFEKELRTALNEGHLQVLYQPIVDVHQRQIVRMEALVRWPHPTRGYLSPGDFLPLAESVGLMEQLGEEVLRSACIAAEKLLQAGKPVNVSVNVNPRQLLYGNFMQTLSQVLSETKLPATSLILEITESAVAVSYTHLRAHETVLDLVCRLLLEKKQVCSGTDQSSQTQMSAVCHVHTSMT